MWEKGKDNDRKRRGRKKEEDKKGKIIREKKIDREGCELVEIKNYGKAIIKSNQKL